MTDTTSTAQAEIPYEYQDVTLELENCVFFHVGPGINSSGPPHDPEAMADLEHRRKMTEWPAT